MTSIAGYNVNTTPCCGTTYSMPRYRSMNFSAWEHWTDGYRDDSLMPNDHGLRKCECGSYYLVKEMQSITHVEQTTAPYTADVPAEELPSAIAQARTSEIELAARLDYWQHLNHIYRAYYRNHRDAEESATQSAWEAANPDTRTWWQKIRKIAPPQYTPQPNRPFTYPPFKPTDEQCNNMKGILQLLLPIEKNRSHLLKITELYRELGQFDEAAALLQQLSQDELSVTSRLIAKFVAKKETAPIRYRM